MYGVKPIEEFCVPRPLLAILKREKGNARDGYKLIIKSLHMEK